MHRTQEPDVFPGQSPSISPHYRPFPPQHVDWSGADGRAESCLGLWSEYCFTTFNSSPLLLPLFPPKRRGEKSYLLSYHCPLQRALAFSRLREGQAVSRPVLGHRAMQQQSHSVMCTSPTCPHGRGQILPAPSPPWATRVLGC